MSYKKKNKQFVNSGSFKSSMKKVLFLLFVVIIFVFTTSAYVDEAKTKVDPEKWKKLTPEQKAKFIKQVREAQKTFEDFNEIIKEVNKAKKGCEYVKDASTKALKVAADGPVGLEKNASEAVTKKAVKEKVKGSIKKSKNKKE